MKQTSQTRLLRDHLDQLLPEGGIERVLDEDYLAQLGEESLELATSEEEAATAIGAVRKLGEDSELTPADRNAVEAIILPKTRPAIDIGKDTYKAPSGYWGVLDQPAIRQHIEAAIPSVARIELPHDPRYKYAGTGFVVGPDLLMTNRHVAEIFSVGLGRDGLLFKPGQTAVSDFREEIAPTESIHVRVLDVVMIHPFFDMALLRVANLPAAQVPLTLGITHPADLERRDVAVIGYPAFDPRNDAKIQHRIFRGTYDVKRLQPGTLTGRHFVESFGNRVHALTHNASTLGGNSGSAIIDLMTGEVVGLHFAGRYRVANYAVSSWDLAKDPYVREAGVRFGGHVASEDLPWRDRWLDADPETSSDSSNTSSSAIAVSSGSNSTIQTTIQAGEARISLPLEITVSLGGAVMTKDATTKRARPVTRDRQAIITGDTGHGEAPATKPDPDYSNREGYDPHFLEGHYVRLPWLTKDQYRDTAKNSEASSQRHVLPYHHFSSVISEKRRLPYFTAVNIDGSKYWHINRDEFDDSWHVDPRISSAYQLQNEYYKKWNGVDNPLDRGHMVRRLDPCWGSTWEEVVAAHHDTFHYTNCAPQHSSFNRNKKIWLGIEDYVLNRAATRDLRVSVFSGPVLDNDNDEWYDTPTGLRLQLPQQYWKVVAAVDASGQLFATAYRLSQEFQIADLVEAPAYGAYRNFQVTVKEIENLTGLWFWGLADHDPLANGNESVVAGSVELESLEDIHVRRSNGSTLPSHGSARKERAAPVRKSRAKPKSKK